MVTRKCIAKVRAVGLLALVVAGCATTPAGSQDLLAFLDREKVSRSEVIAEIGEPSATFEDGRVLMYRLSRGKSGLYVNTGNPSWEGIESELLILA